MSKLEKFFTFIKNSHSWEPIWLDLRDLDGGIPISRDSFTGSYNKRVGQYIHLSIKLDVLLHLLRVTKIMLTEHESHVDDLKC